MERESMLIYKSFIDVSEGLNDEDYRKFWTAIFKYGLTGEEIPKFNNPVLDAVMVLVIPIVKANIKNYLNGCKGGASSESMRGNGNAKKKKQTENKPKTNPKQTENKGNVNVNDTVNVTDTDTDTDTATINKKEIYKEKVEERNPYIDINTMSITDFDKYDEWNKEHGIEEG